MDTSRRRFVRMTAAAGMAGGWGSSGASQLQRRPLGETGLQVSIVGLGGARLGILPNHETSVEIVRLCYELGVNYFDAAAAATYGLSQDRFGLALKGLRDRIVLATKTRHRTYTQAQLDLNHSLTALSTDYIDLYQIHNVINDEDVEFIFGPKGVMELVEKAKKQGKIRFVGVTGHADPLLLNRIITRYPFDTVLMPLSVTDGANKERSFEKTTLPLAREKGMGIIAMKALGAGRILRQRVATVEEALHYVWSLPISTVIVGCDRLDQVRTDIRLARDAKAPGAVVMERLRRRTAQLALKQMEPWKNVPLRTGTEPGYQAD